MDTAISIFLILTALLTGAMSPGPSFILVANTTLSLSRRHGIAAAAGMGAGGVILAILALMGLHSVLTTAPAVYLVFKVLGGLYLACLAVRLWRGANFNLKVDGGDSIRRNSLKKSFFISLGTQLSNPKAVVIYSGIFAALLPQEIPNGLYFLLPPLVFLVETAWYLLVAIVLSTSSSRAVYLSSKSILDRISACVMGVLSFRLLSSVTIN